MTQEALRRIVLDELDRDGVVVSLDDSHADLLRATGLVNVHTASPGWWRLVPDQRVGAVRLGDIDIEVRPKVGISRLLFLLGYANEPGFGGHEAGADTADELWPTLAESLIQQTERAIRRRLLPGYQTVQEPSTVIRGRISVTEQINRRPGLLTPVEVQYDELTIDTVEHRILRTALHRMASLPRLPARLHGRLHELDNMLRGVSLLRTSRPAPRWHVDRRTAHYAAALRLASIVLQHQSFEYGPGSLTAASFVVRMAPLFERFATIALREALLPYRGATSTQLRSYLDTNSDVSIRPDLVYAHDGKNLAVVDAKYVIDEAVGHNRDIYQLLAYCTALQATRGFLVYAHGTTPPRRTRVRNTAIDLVSYPLDLSATPTGLLGQIQTLAHDASGVTKSSEPT
ncbi:McrC family protein [Plantactinospora sp. BB1]|uniref:McrC family protein n=1 Tax=Plantactinospora sp. BB1 TaxID=2071627 RepID=UPI000D178B6E|nr:restriction endonuclease [Plantactinospora sp. BB1]AVT39619.1 restriction endonuclease [Plantactinospora sp. BB1]